MKKNEISLKELLGAFVETPKIKDKYHLVSIKEAWRQNLGSTITGYTSEIRFRKGVMTVCVTSAPLREELLSGREKLIRLLNEALPEPIIREIQIY
ncbi:MAG: DUF721 domain-containing protein [Saprospiraceae bacterium]|nr:DUF721 domain-containing protein [Saprospiraceae bacterium]